MRERVRKVETRPWCLVLVLVLVGVHSMPAVAPIYVGCRYWCRWVGGVGSLRLNKSFLVGTSVAVGSLQSIYSIVFSAPRGWWWKGGTFSYETKATSGSAVR
jgi:hypothetical protein